MTSIYLIRHGRAAASFTDDVDPGLDDLGISQAEAACSRLEDKLPLTLLTSPLRRAQETAAPLVKTTGLPLTIENRMAEIPSPGLSLEERGPWLQRIMQGRWSEQSQALQKWHSDLSDCLLNIDTDTAIFSHFVAINAAVGAAEDNDQVLLFQPDNGSITVINTDGVTLTLVSRGEVANTRVN